MGWSGKDRGDGSAAEYGYLGVKVLRARFRRFTVCPMRIALLAVALAACGADDDAPATDPFVGEFDVRWSGMMAPPLNSAEIVETSGDATHILYLGTNGTQDMTLICNPESDCILCETLLARESAMLCVVGGEVEGSFTNQDGSWLIELNRR